MSMQFAVQQADLVYQQINNITSLLDTFNARKAGLLHEADRRSASGALDDTRPAKQQRVDDKEGSQSPVPLLLLRNPILPTEILDLVLHHVQEGTRNRDLLNVAISNKSLNAIAIRYIYHTIRLANPKESVLCLQTLTQHPRLAALVRSLNIHWASFTHPTRNLYRLTRTALLNAKSLTTLSIDVPGDFHPWNIQDCTFALKEFSASFPCNKSLIRFLETQPSIADLTLRGFNSDPSDFSFNLSTFNLNPNPSPFSLSPDALPNLTRLRAIHAGPDIIGSIIKDRPVRQVSMPLYADCACKSLKALELSSEPIERLNIISFDPNAPEYLLAEVANRLPDLEALHIVILLAQCSEKLLEASAPALTKFKQLQYLTYMSATPTNHVSQEDEQKIAVKWHQCCPTLKTIILPMGKVWFHENSKWSCLEDA